MTNTMEWTKRSPIAQGWYWLRSNGGPPQLVQVQTLVHYTRDDLDGRPVVMFGQAIPVLVDGIAAAEWSGPLPMPEEPF